MKYTLSVPQKGIIDGGFDIDVLDGVILDFMITFSHSPYIMKMFEGDSCYYWFDYKYIIENIPLLKLKKDAVYRRVKHMCDVGLLQASTENQRLGKPYFKIMPAAVGLYFSVDGTVLNPDPYGFKTVPPTDLKPDPLRVKNRTPTDLKPDNNIIIDNNINNATIKDKIIIDQAPPALPVVSDENINRVILPWDSLAFEYAWTLWKQYKKQQHRFTFKSILSEQAALNRVAKITGGDETLAIDTINYSIAQSYQGIFLENGTGIKKTGNGGGSAIPAATPGGVMQNIAARFNKTGNSKGQP